jgi:UDP-N-acetylmuramoyl-tripeptide--D-alanyl-D-alanine ligase
MIALKSVAPSRPAAVPRNATEMPTPIPANRAPLEARAAAEATGGVVGARAGRVARGVTTDSRAVTPGCAFVALRGLEHDGHAYLDAAIEAGAVLVVVERGRAPRDTSKADVVEVDDTLAAWGAIARAHLRTWREDQPWGRVVAITGSAGKTTTKELCAALLRTAGACHASAGNLNNRVGLPAVVLQVEPSHRFVVLEMGMSVPGEIAALAAIAEPDVGVVTNIGLAHAAGVGGTIGDVANEKGALLEAVRPGGVVVVNADDSAVVGQLHRAALARVVTFGAAEQAGYRLLSRQPVGVEGSMVTVQRGGETATFRVPLLGGAAAIDFVAALAAAEAATGATIEGERLALALKALGPLPGRMHLRCLRGGVLVLDDAYNASPATMRAALATLTEVAQGRRVVVLGEMKELGPAARREHDLLGVAVADAGVALLVSCGGLAEAAAREAERRGVTIVLARDADEAALAAVERIRQGDAVLVKASRSVGAERVVEALVRAHGEPAR